MEHGSAIGTYLAYATIVLFLVLLGIVVGRTVLLTSVLLFSPVRRVWTWLTSGFGRRGGTEQHAILAPRSARCVWIPTSATAFSSPRRNTLHRMRERRCRGRLEARRSHRSSLRMFLYDSRRSARPLNQR